MQTTSLADNRCKTEKITLAKWLFTNSHFLSSLPKPDNIQQIAAITENQKVALIYERLLTVTCKKAAKKAVSKKGVAALDISADTLAEIAMESLLSDIKVSKGLSGFEQFLDEKAIEAILF